MPLACLLALAGCAAPRTDVPSARGAAADDPELAARIEAERKLQARTYIERDLAYHRRVTELGADLVVAARPLCGDNIGPWLGMQVDTVSRQPARLREHYREYHGVEDEDNFVLLLVPDAPAALAGVREGDLVVSLNGEPYVAELHDYPDVVAGPNTLALVRDGDGMEIVVEAGTRCNFNVVHTRDDAINAFADGENIIINTGLLDFLHDDNALRHVIAHEIAHNAYRHVQAMRQNATVGTLLDVLVAATTGVGTVAFTELASSYQSQEFEQEADYVGLYIMAIAGHPIDDAPELWRVLGAKTGGFVGGRGLIATHPTTPERSVAMMDAISEIKAKFASGEELVPNFRAR